MTSGEPSSSKLLRYDVFLSFRGEDTRNGFTSHLHAALQGGGFNAFIDEDDLKRGGEIKPELLRAIEESRISVIVFSKSYAESRWCLDELVKIMKCRKGQGQQVLPIFYHVDPSHVRKQEGCLARAFQNHENGILEEKDDKEREAKKKTVKQWREALTQAANLSGHHLNNGPEAKDIKTIVGNIRELLRGTDEFQVAKYPVGIDSRVQPIISHLFSGGLNDVKMLGIWGMGGLGKTTAANAIYDKIRHRFEFTCHLGDVSDTEHRNGLVYLQKQLVSNISKQTTQINSVGEGIGVIKRYLPCRKVLIVIDNVDKVEQLSALADDREWFGPGSIIIITTRDEHLLKQAGVKVRYAAEEMNEEEALELFSWYTFKNNCPKEEYLELSRKVVSYCGGLPLALKVLGSSLFGRPITEWQSYLEKLKRIPEGEIIKKLKISFDGLDDNQKTIFLHIFCCFLGLEKDHVTKILDECDLHATSDISVLRERCLITFEGDELKMHDLIQEMGKTIISEKSPTQPGRWSRPWNLEAITDVLTNKSGTEEIEALSLHLPSSEKKASFCTKAFVNMKKLRFLRLSYVELAGSFKHFPKELRWLCWHGFPFKYMPKHLLNQPKLVALDLRGSNLRKGWKNSKPLENLKILDLSCSKKLKKSPDFSRLPNLEELNFLCCYSLSKIHPSIGQLKKLKTVGFEYCNKLRYLPAEFCKLKSVETLYLNDCEALRELPEGIGEMVSLRDLDATSTNMKQFPNDLGRLISLQKLIVTGCFIHSLLHSLPSLRGLSNLVELQVEDIDSLRAIPDLPTNLKELHVFRCSALEKMPDFSQLSSMRRLYLRDLPKVTEVPGLGLGKSLNSMAEIEMKRCTNLTAEFRNNILQGWTFSRAGVILRKTVYGIPEWYDSHIGGNKVTEVPGLGLGKSLNSMAELNMGGCTDLTAEFMNNILQGWTYGGAGGILLDKIYGIPEWFDFVADGNKVSFDIPQCDGCNFKGLTLCGVWLQVQPTSVPITVVNCTKRTILRVSWYLSVVQGQFWQVHLSKDQFKLNLQGGDKIVILIEDFEVEKTGVNLVWDKPLKENKSPVILMDDYYFEYESEAVPDWLYGESSPGPSHGASDNHPTNQMTATTDEPKRKRQKV